MIIYSFDKEYYSSKEENMVFRKCKPNIILVGNPNCSELLKRVYDHVLESKNSNMEFTSHLMLCINNKEKEKEEQLAWHFKRSFALENNIIVPVVCLSDNKKQDWNNYPATQKQNLYAKISTQISNTSSRHADLSSWRFLLYAELIWGDTFQNKNRGIMLKTSMIPTVFICIQKIPLTNIVS